MARYEYPSPGVVVASHRSASVIALYRSSRRIEGEAVDLFFVLELGVVRVVAELLAPLEEDQAFAKASNRDMSSSYQSQFFLQVRVDPSNT